MILKQQQAFQHFQNLFERQLRSAICVMLIQIFLSIAQRLMEPLKNSMGLGRAILMSIASH